MPEGRESLSVPTLGPVVLQPTVEVSTVLPGRVGLLRPSLTGAARGPGTGWVPGTGGETETTRHQGPHLLSPTFPPQNPPHVRTNRKPQGKPFDRRTLAEYKFEFRLRKTL